MLDQKLEVPCWNAFNKWLDWSLEEGRKAFEAKMCMDTLCYAVKEGEEWGPTWHKNWDFLQWLRTCRWDLISSRMWNGEYSNKPSLSSTHYTTNIYHWETHMKIAVPKEFTIYWTLLVGYLTSRPLAFIYFFRNIYCLPRLGPYSVCCAWHVSLTVSAFHLVSTVYCRCYMVAYIPSDLYLHPALLVIHSFT